MVKTIQNSSKTDHRIKERKTRTGGRERNPRNLCDLDPWRSTCCLSGSVHEVFPKAYVRGLTQFVTPVTQQGLVAEGVSVIANFIYCLVHTEWVCRSWGGLMESVPLHLALAPRLCLPLLLSGPEPHSFVSNMTEFSPVPHSLSMIVCPKITVL